MESSEDSSEDINSLVKHVISSEAKVDARTRLVNEDTEGLKELDDTLAQTQREMEQITLELESTKRRLARLNDVRDHRRFLSRRVHGALQVAKIRYIRALKELKRAVGEDASRLVMDMKNKRRVVK